MLLVDRIQESTKVLGPGTRVAVWFHGCFRNCPGCIAAGMNNSSDFSSYKVEELVSKISSIEGVEGLTISGGEPFQQNLSELCIFLKMIRQNTKLSIMAYTGYIMAELIADPQKKKLLEYIDILIDGPYIEHLDYGQLWRGSENQKIYFLSSRYKALEGIIEKKKGRPIEVDFIEGLQFSMTGVPPRGFREKLKGKLAEKGMNVNW